MKYTLLLFMLFAFLYAEVNAQTRIADKQYVSGKWKKSKSPYIIEGEAIVPKGATLKIKPGTTILLKTGKNIYYYKYNSSERKYIKTDDFDMGMIRVNGTLIAKGKKKKKITFSRNGNSGYWGSILFNSKNADNLMDYCIVENAHYVNYINADGKSAEGSVAFLNAKGTISNTIVRENSTSAGIISTYDSQPIIKGNLIDNCFYGISFGHGAEPTVENNVCINNYLGLRAYYCPDAILKNMTFYNNRKASLKLQSQNLNVLNSIIADKAVGAQYGTENKLTLDYSLISNKTQEDFIHYKSNNLFGMMPFFIDENNKNFNIKSDSPAKGKGQGGDDMGANLSL